MVKEEFVYAEDMNNFTPPKKKNVDKEKDKSLDKIFEDIEKLNKHNNKQTDLRDKFHNFRKVNQIQKQYVRKDSIFNKKF